MIKLTFLTELCRKRLGQMKDRIRNGCKFLLFLFVAILCSCKGNVVDVSKLLAERDSVMTASMQQKEELEKMNEFLAVISNGIDSISIKEGFIRNTGREGTGMSREQMRQSLQELAEMLTRQRQRIEMLEDSLKLKGVGGENLHNIVAYLNEQLLSKEAVINQLRSEINNKNTDIANLQSLRSSEQATYQAQISSLNRHIDDLGKKNEAQKQVLAAQSDMMNECYMKIGTKKQLKQSGILDGRKLNPGGLTPDKFVRVDIREFRELKINSKKPRILTTMPHNSFSIVRNSDGSSTLTITNPSSFWSSSNYLVIVTD